MDYEQKYKDALERAKKLYGQGTITESLDFVFPELNEKSYGERIRKELIEHIKANKGSDYVLFKKFSPDDVIAWLEKQGEQKPTDKVEPKFKVGDWVVFIASESIYQVEKIENYEYTLRHILGGSLCLSFSNEELIREWTIQDAKDGDVLVDKSDGTIGIFQSIGHHPDGGSYNDHSYCFLHCRYDDGYFYADFENGNTMDSDDVIPATKEQRDTLERAMTNAGYRWDAEKKEVKKISPKTLDHDKVIEWLKRCNFDYGDVHETIVPDSTPTSNIEKTMWFSDSFINRFKKDFGL